MRPTWTSAGNLRTVLLGLASGGVCLAAVSPRRRCALTAPFHPCLRLAAHRRCLFCGTFPRVPAGRRAPPPCLVRPGLPARLGGGGRPATAWPARATYRLG